MDSEDDLLMFTASEKATQTSVADPGQSSKRAANSPATNDDKKPRMKQTESSTSLKLLVRLSEGFVDEQFFNDLMSQLFTIQQKHAGGAILPTFTGSGYSQGTAWFTASNVHSKEWLVNSLQHIADKKILPEFDIQSFVPIQPLRKIIFSAPLVPKLDRNAHKVVLNMIAKLNSNLDIKFWKVSRICPP